MTATESRKIDSRKALKDIIEDKKERHRKAHENYREWVREKQREKEREKIVSPMDLAIQRHEEDKKKNPNKLIQPALTLEQMSGKEWKKLSKEEQMEHIRRRQHPDPEEQQFDYKQSQEEERKKHQLNLLLHYSAKIHGVVPEYEKSYEEQQEERGDNLETREELFHEESAENMILDSTPKKPEGITKTQWLKEVRQKRKKIKEKRKQRRLDEKYEFLNSPQERYIEMLEGFRWGGSACECEAEKMRAGICCKTCKLFIPLREYTIQLFKDAAEGRSSYV